MPKFVDLPAETEPVRQETHSDRVLQALRELGGFASQNQIALHARMDIRYVIAGLHGIPARSVQSGWLLLEDGMAQCPTCGGEYREA